MIVSSLDNVAGLVLSAICLMACWQDIQYRRLPNWLTLSTAVGGIGYAALGGFLLSAALHMALALAAGLLLFGVRAVGAGDAKYYSALALYFPLQSAGVFVGLIGVGAIFLLIGSAVWAIVIRYAHNYDLRSRLAERLPFGVAISIGGWSTWLIGRVGD